MGERRGGEVVAAIFEGDLKLGFGDEGRSGVGTCVESADGAGGEDSLGGGRHHGICCWLPVPEMSALCAVFVTPTQFET